MNSPAMLIASISSNSVCGSSWSRTPSANSSIAVVSGLPNTPNCKDTQLSPSSPCSTALRRSIEDEVASLVAAGGTFLDLRQDPNSYGNPYTFAVMQDPEGNEFCVLNAESVTGMA
jgi:hypothetical protein